MITTNDLYDIYYALVLIRHDVECRVNCEVLESISSAIRSDYAGDNSVRMAIREIADIDREKWGFAFHENVYTYREPIKDGYTTKILGKVVRILMGAMECGEFQRAYDFVDAVHFIPLIVAKGDRLSVRLLGKLTKEYAKKWGKIVWN